MKSKKKFVLAGLVLLAVIITGLALTGCETEVDPSTPQQEQTGGNSGNSGGGNTQQPGGDNTGNGGNNSGGEDEVGGEKPVTYTVTFNTNGGSEVASQTVESGQKASPPAEPELEGSWFLGWYGDKELTTKFDFSAPITADTTVYAKWSYRLHTKPTELTEYTSPNHTSSEWTYVEFGEWPQTIKKDNVTVDETKSKTVGMFTYYLGSDGNHYVKQDDKYYKVEPIVWRVLTTNYTAPEGGTTGNALLLAENILTGGIKWADSSNNYMESNIRAWLNGNSGTGAASDYIGAPGFLQSAFTDVAQNLIAITTVDNSKVSTNPDGNATLWSGGKNQYACANTSDKVFLLSEKEATTDTYGFAAYDRYVGDSYGTTSSTRIRVTTDYAKATGAYQSSSAGYGGWWWLRSPSCYYGDVARFIFNDGNAYYSDSVSFTDGGVVPALCVKLWQ